MRGVADEHHSPIDATIDVHLFDWPDMNRVNPVELRQQARHGFSKIMEQRAQALAFNLAALHGWIFRFASHAIGIAIQAV
jgi:hypothetical protein